MKDPLEMIPCEVFSVDPLAKHAEVKVMSRDNMHEWAHENGGPIEITDAMKKAALDVFEDSGLSSCDLKTFMNDGIDTPQCVFDFVSKVYAAMETKRREGMVIDRSERRPNVPTTPPTE